MIKTLNNVAKAYENYNPATGIGRAELYKALTEYYKKYIEITELLEKVDLILKGGKN